MNEHMFDLQIATAPSWFVPELQKLCVCQHYHSGKVVSPHPEGCAACYAAQLIVAAIDERETAAPTVKINLLVDKRYPNCVQLLGDADGDRAQAANDMLEHGGHFDACRKKLDN